MQSRYRSSSDGYRPASGYRNPNRGGFGGGGGRRPHQKPYPPPPPPAAAAPPRKADVFMEAGRLAAEYLVFKGFLPPNSLPPKRPGFGRFQEFKGPGREPEGRTSALARLGNPVVDRRVYDDDDEFTHMDSRSRQRVRKRNGPYTREYNPDWGTRDDGRRGQWVDRDRGYHDAMEGGDDGFTPVYPRVRRGFDDVGSSVSRVAVSDDRYSKSEATGESGTVVDTREMVEDTGSKASSTSTRKDPSADADGSNVVDDAKVLSPEEVKSNAGGNSKRRMDMDEDEQVNAHENSSKPWSFTKVPTKPRSSGSQISPRVEQDTKAVLGSTLGASVAGGAEVAEGAEPVEESPADSHKDQIDTVKSQEPVIFSALPDDPMEENVESHLETEDCPPGFAASEMPVDASEDGGIVQHIDKMEGIETQIILPPASVTEVDEDSSMVSETKQSSLSIEELSMDEKMVEGVDQEKSIGEDATLLPNLEEEKQLLTTSFDLNLMGTPEVAEIPEITVIPDDPVDHLQTSGPIAEDGNELPVDVDLSIGNNTNVTDEYVRLSNTGKEIQVINLEDDSPMDHSGCDPSKLKNEPMFPSLENFSSQTPQADLDDIHDGYSLAFSEFLGNDMSGCSAVPGDLNNLQTGISLHHGQGVSGDDDSIYVSLDEIPIGFMGLWDQPPQEYGKFF